MPTKKIKNRSKRRAFKRHFQLLEILIALFLVATCAIPVMGSFVSIYLEQRKMQEEIHLDHLMHLAHAKFVEHLYREGAKGSSLKELIDATSITLPVLDGWQALEEQSNYVFFYKLTKEKPQEVKNKLLLQIEIYAAKNGNSNEKTIHSHTCKVYVERSSKDGQDEFANAH